MWASGELPRPLPTSKSPLGAGIAVDVAGPLVPDGLCSLRGSAPRTARGGNDRTGRLGRKRGGEGSKGRRGLKGEERAQRGAQGQRDPVQRFGNIKSVYEENGCEMSKQEERERKSMRKVKNK